MHTALRRNLPRLLMLLVITCLVTAGLYLLLFTHAGAQLRHNPHQFHARAHDWAAAHPRLAPATVVGLFVILTVSMMPVWWVMILAGASFGLLWGVVWCEVGATIGATLTFLLSRWLAADFFHGRIESKMGKLRALDERLSHNGFLVVMVARLIHVLPFGPSYYMFGVTTMTAADVAVGTLLGYIPTCMLLVQTGAGWPHGHARRFVLTLIALQGILLIPILLRYLAPDWFKKVGIE